MRGCDVPDRAVGANGVRKLYAVMERERVDKDVIITTLHFSREMTGT